jgi:hypothetical protein
VNGVPISVLIDDLTPSGFIALQVHAIAKDAVPGKEIRWRNIKINTKNLKAMPLDQTPVVNLLTNKLSEQEKFQGFVSLFNGTDMTGWRNVHSDKTPSVRWKTQDGILMVGGSDGSETGNDIVTKDKYSAFELVFDFKLTEGANSGIKYFVDESYDSNGKSGVGLEFQILDDAKHPDAKEGVVGNRTLGSLYDLIPSIKVEPRFQKKIGDWNTGRVIVYPDNKVQHWLNGYKVVEYERKSPIYNALVARSKYVKYPGFGAADAGHILIQDHGDNVSFRNIKIRKIN